MDTQTLDTDKMVAVTLRLSRGWRCLIAAFIIILALASLEIAVNTEIMRTQCMHEYLPTSKTPVNICPGKISNR